jgi:3-(methylthio)propionyl---CoA ligase
VDEAAIRTYLEGKIAKWWMPDAVRFVDGLPRNGVGKVMKAALREEYHGILLETPGTAAAE